MTHTVTIGPNGLVRQNTKYLGHSTNCRQLVVVGFIERPPSQHTLEDIENDIVGIFAGLCLVCPPPPHTQNDDTKRITWSNPDIGPLSP
jgi:hypothetical protein